jgi:shikimate kinase
VGLDLNKGEPLFLVKTNIIIMGFMGTGKSATGRLVAKRLERVLVDMDAEIERREGRKIGDIFSQEGEPYFRKVEREVVKDLCRRENLIVAAGGGVVINPENVHDFSRTGVVICLSAEPSVILQRVASETHRPLIEGGEKARKITDLLELRKPLYDAIPNQIDTTRLSPELTADRIIEIYEKAAKE